MQTKPVYSKSYSTYQLQHSKKSGRAFFYTFPSFIFMRPVIVSDMCPKLRNGLSYVTFISELLTFIITLLSC